MRENLVKPNFDTYHILIHACGKAGYAYKAQKLLFEFISRGQNPTKYMYTDVFTACAKSPIEERKNSLNYARRLRNKLNITSFKEVVTGAFRWNFVFLNFVII